MPKRTPPNTTSFSKPLLTILKEAVAQTTDRIVGSIAETRGTRYVYPVTFTDGTTTTLTDVYRYVGNENAVITFSMDGRKYCARFEGTDLKSVRQVRQ